MLNRVLAFHAPTRLIFGPGALAEVIPELKRLGVGKPLLVTDQGIRAAGLLGRVTSLLEEHGVPSATFDGVKENPSVETVADGLKIYANEGCDGLIPIGGGSPIDTGKAIGILASNNGEIAQYEGVGKVPRAIPPTIAVPTTYGTGSETTSVAVITDPRRHFKFVIVSPNIFCSSAILDPTLLLSLPRKIGAATGMDALTHAIEAYVALGSQPFASALALHAIGLVAGNLRQAVANDQNLAATQNMVIASALAGMAFSNARLGTVHAMAHPLSAHCGIHHGTACAILLPHVMEFNLGACPEKYAEIARAMGGTTAGLAVMDAARLAVEAVRALASDVDIPANLRAAGATPDRLQELIGDSMLSGAIRNNPRTTGKEDVEHLFSKAFA